MDLELICLRMQYCNTLTLTLTVRALYKCGYMVIHILLLRLLLFLSFNKFAVTKSISSFFFALDPNAVFSLKAHKCISFYPVSFTLPEFVYAVILRERENSCPYIKILAYVWFRDCVYGSSEAIYTQMEVRCDISTRRWVYASACHCIKFLINVNSRPHSFNRSGRRTNSVFVLTSNVCVCAAL